MQTVKIRAQGGAMIVTIPRDVASGLGWDVGTEVMVERQGEAVSFKSCQRKPRGAFTVSELLGQIDRDEIRTLNEDVDAFTRMKPEGKEYW
ncbi:antitoxin [Serratia marcescens]|uniref:Antitoxin n=1 Tax=Serratia marcescens TaxID=615 RepID=A0A5C7C649_SERMA|nr:antitoxin [Serratia marcescens]TXE28355.1 antitoxin [Serratia marcescens]TXE56837.1 antitoxin [Serratia marcescens]